MTPILLASVGAIALLLLIAAWRSQRELRLWLGRDISAARRWLRALLLTAASVLVSAALLTAVQQPPRLSAPGVDLVIAMDVSRSMDARDVAPSRLRRAKRLAVQIVEQAQAARLGLVVFAGDAFEALPLTQDRDALFAYLRALDTDLISRPGTNLARALRAGLRIFDPRSSRPRRLLLFSDGEDAGSALDPALAELRTNGVRIDVVGFGRVEGAAVPGPGGQRLLDRRGRPVVSQRSDGLLERVASATGGRYFRELEDRPQPDQLLPVPRRGRAPVATAVQGPSAILLLAILAALGLELGLSIRQLQGRRTGLQRLAVLALALGLTGSSPRASLERGDLLLEQGEPRSALSAYRRAERRSGSSPESRIRIGNALYRLGEKERAAAHFLEALRRMAPGDVATRFVASFNLGNTLLARKRFEEARDAFWSALLARPESLPAKFNYEWAAERIEPPEPLPIPRSSEADGDAGEENEADSPGSEGTGDAHTPAARESSGLGKEEAERWLESIEEPLGEVLRRQIARKMEARPRSIPVGQSW